MWWIQVLGCCSWCNNEFTCGDERCDWHLMLMKFFQPLLMIIMCSYCDLCSQDLSFVHISFLIIYWVNIMRKRGVLQLALQLNFWIIEYICDSLYLYVVSANGQIAWVVELQLIVYTVQFIVIQLQLNQNNSFQLLFNSIITTPMMSCWCH